MSPSEHYLRSEHVELMPSVHVIIQLCWHMVTYSLV